MAVRSPSSATSAARAVQNRMMAPGSAQQKATASSGQVAACRLPASQIIAVCTSRTSAVVIKMPTAAARLQETPMPIKIKRGREQSRASVRTSRATAMPPTIPASGRQTRPTAGKNSTSARTTMLAPSLTPISPGSASPLRVMLCIAAPASPSMAPHSSAIRIRGRRISNRIKRGCSPISWGASRARASVDAGSG